MAYLGHKPAVGENNSFRILDDISSFVLTFDGSSASVVGLSDETITITENNHRFITGQRVTYSNGGGGNITGLTNGQAYFVINHSKTQIKLASSASNALAGTAVNLTGLGTGSSHTLTLAFDGVNTKFDPTFGDGMHDTLIKRAAQLVISINGVIQQPHDTATPSTGFGVDSLGHIIFSTAPASTDIFWGHILASNTVTFDSSDNDVDTFTGDGSTTSFTLSKIPPDNRNILVTIDGVVQYPSDAANTRSYNVSENVMTFVAAPGLGTVIQVRHIGYAGIGAGGGGGVTGFYGRTGNVSLQSTDNIVANNATFSGNVSIAQTLTYEDVTDIDAIGLITARSGIKDQTLTAGRVIYVDSDKTLTDSANLTFGSSGVLNLKGASGNTQLSLHRTNTNTTGTAGVIGFYASDGHAVSGLYAIGDGDNEGAHLVFKTTSAASGTNIYSDLDERVRITSGGLLKVNSTDSGSYHTIRLNTTTNNAIKDVLHVHSSVDSATAAAGYGVRLNFSGEQSNGNEYTFGGIAGLFNSTGATYGDLAFYTNNNGTNGERLRITSDGDLSLRATTQNAHLGLTANSTAINLTLGSTAGSAPRAYFYGTGNGQTTAGDIFLGAGTGGELRFRAGQSIKLQTNSDNSTIDAFFIHAAGTVAVNTFSPDTTYKLDVLGAGQFTTSSTNQQNDFNTGQLTLKNNQNAQGAFIDFRAKTNTGIQGVIAKIGGFNTYSGSGYDGLLTFSTRQNSSNTMVERMRIDNNNRILIGTSNPINTSTSKFQVASNDANGSAILARFNANVYSSYLDFYKSRSNTLGTAYVVNDNDHLGAIRYYAADGSNSGYTTAAEIYGSCDGGSGSASDMPGRITFHTRPDGAGEAMKERLRISSAGKVLVGDGSVITPSRNLDVRGSGHQQILLGSTNNQGASLMVDGAGGGDGSGGDYCTFEAASDGHLKIRNYDADKNIIFGVGSNTGAEDTLILTSAANLGLSNTGTNNPNNYSGWCTFTINGSSGSELDFEKGGSLKGDFLANDTSFNMTTRDSAVDINFATKNNAGSTANRLTISSEGNIRHVDGSGVSYFNGASEYVFGSTGSSPASGGAEANVQIHAHKTRAQFSINAYMNNAGGPFMQLVSSRSSTVGQLGTVTLNNDVLGDIRFSADDGNGGVVYGAQIKGRAKTQATTNGIAGRIEFATAKDASSTTRDVFSMNEGGAFTAESENAALYGHYTSVNDGNKYVDFSQWTRDSFICLEIFGNVNPNSAGSGAYLDPVHMYVYRGIGWTGSRVGYYIYSVSVAPPARHAFPSGTGYSGNAQISAVWTDGTSVIGNETATTTHYMRLQIPNANTTYSFPKQFRIFRRR